MKKLYIKTYGCQMNEYDSAKIFDVLRASHGLELTIDPKKADLILINTCSVREKAQEKVFSELGRYRLLKENRPEVVIGVGGCLASQEGKTIIKRVPFVDIIFGPQTLHRLPELLNKFMQTRQPSIDITFPEIEKFDHLPEPKASGPTAFISIMEGCSKYCTFCIVPYTRGEEISRPFDDVVAEVVKLGQQGVREITLLGQNVNDYRGLMYNGQVADLAVLIHYLSAIDDIQRIRFITSHPSEFSESLIDAYEKEPKLANHLHLPVQSGSDRILSAMKRRYTVLEFKSKIRKLRKIRPNISISSDFIVGFPGETATDFEATINLVREIGFDHSFSFIYSPRPGTPAAQFPDDVSLGIKKERLAVLQSYINVNAAKISQAMLETEQQVLVTGSSKKYSGQLNSQTENNRVVNFIGAPSLIGRIVRVKIQKARLNSFWGEILG
ncbi:tRNA (N6-isopentenyl adenosine(37)-C2)-methylthiotransferase MiaB [Coxiella endosymbiont of Amblyomma nuttalli]|uniref:tRNA (N6-isopentenyl adenosine(37)-C2)-methylthiotransferase MiaB n=1 Tax=Coxiella endosymbiont of Amblyomma nuttalli TaxID=2749996 RepID=UPI001BA47BEA|nr:tRNA (N6-isopentenyl adenosine(37)-C2)-methylthiotransferase MiaB [Coxiella endosymbiont of Amblyomma nuttalli]QTS83893.1 (Dimethylallyl)adenosine tRNA methylthiotransferase MiaB [Coxiella endosymbiont of Amblyomma nuttalli]